MTAESTGTSTGAALERCVSVGRDDFAKRYYGRAPLLTRAADFAAQHGLPAPGLAPNLAAQAFGQRGFTDLLCVEGVDELLSRRGVRTPFLRIAKDGKLVPPGRFTGGGGTGAEVADQVIDDRVLDLFAGGATLVLQGLHRLWPPLIEFSGQLAGELGCPVQVNAYITPAGNRGFATHYDTHDVFILQVAGRKRWRVHPPVLPDPLEQQPWGGVAQEVAATAGGPATLDEQLAPGDALYLPRGWLHSAEALGERSLHLTLGLHRPTRYTLVEALLAMAAQEPRLRASLPLGVDPTDPDQLGPDLAETVSTLRNWLSTVDETEVAERLRPSQWATRRAAPIAPIAQAAAADAVHEQTRVMVRPGLRWRLRPADDGRVTLYLPGRAIDMPGSCAQAVRAALNGPAIRVGNLPGLDAEDAIVLARRLLREAVIVPTGG